MGAQCDSVTRDEPRRLTAMQPPPLNVMCVRRTEEDHCMETVH